MFSSEFDNEVLVAARAVHAKMIANDWTWEALLANGSRASLTEQQIQKVYAAGMQRGEIVGYQRGMADAQAMGTPPPKGPSIEIADDLDWLTHVLDAAEQARPNGPFGSIRSRHLEQYARQGNEVRPGHVHQPTPIRLVEAIGEVAASSRLPISLALCNRAGPQ
jgi:hypothetical protein